MSVLSQQQTMKFDRWVRSLLLFALTALLTWGCSRTILTTLPLTLPSIHCQPTAPSTDCDRPRKIAVLSPYGLDLLLSLGEQPAAYAGVSASRQPFNHPIEQVPYLGRYVTTQPINLGDRASPALEALVLLKPDLIVGETWQGSQGRDKLFSQIAPTLLLDDQQGGWQASLQQLASILDRSNMIPQIMAARNERITQARQKLAEIANAHPRVLLLSSGDLTSNFYAFGQERSIYSDLLETLGFKIVRFDESLLETKDAFQLPAEVLPQLEPDILIVLGWDKNDADNRPLNWRQLQQQWNQSPLLKSMPISQSGRVYFMDAHLTMLRGSLAEAQILNDLLQQLAPNS